MNSASAYEKIRKLLRENLPPGEEPPKLTDQNIAIIRHFDQRLRFIEAALFPAPPSRIFEPGFYQAPKADLSQPKYDQEA